MTTTYSRAQKEKALDALRKLLEKGDISPSGEMQELSRLLNIPAKTLYGWKSDLKKELGGSKRNIDKLQVIMETSSMNELELGEYLRTNGIFKEELDSWIATARSSFDKTRTAPSDTAHTQKELKKLQAELKRKEKALAEAAALLVLSKKAQAIWGENEED